MVTPTAISHTSTKSTAGIELSSHNWRRDFLVHGIITVTTIFLNNDFTISCNQRTPDACLPSYFINNHFRGIF